MLAVGILGATVMPHVVYLHSALTQDRIRARDDGERRRAAALPARGRRDRHGARRRDQPHDARGRGRRSSTTRATRRSTRSRARTPGFERLLGGGAALAFAVALLASGLSSSSVGTYAGQVVMQGFIDRRIPLFLRRLVTMLPALVVLAIGLDATDVLVISQVVLSFGIPFALVPMILLTRRARRHGRARQPARHDGRRVRGGDADHRPQRLPALRHVLRLSRVAGRGAGTRGPCPTEDEGRAARSARRAAHRGGRGGRRTAGAGRRPSAPPASHPVAGSSAQPQSYTCSCGARYRTSGTGRHRVYWPADAPEDQPVLGERVPECGAALPAEPAAPRPERAGGRQRRTPVLRTAPLRPTQPTHATQPTQFTQPTHATQPAQPTLPRPASTPAERRRRRSSATPALPTTPVLPATRRAPDHAAGAGDPGAAHHAAARPRRRCRPRPAAPATAVLPVTPALSATAAARASMPARVALRAPAERSCPGAARSVHGEGNRRDGLGSSPMAVGRPLTNTRLRGRPRLRRSPTSPSPAWTSALLARRAALPAALAAAALAVLLLAGGPLGVLTDALNRALEADPRWIGVAAVAEVLSFTGYVALFWLVGRARDPPARPARQRRGHAGRRGGHAPAPDGRRRRRGADGVGDRPHRPRHAPRRARAPLLPGPALRRLPRRHRRCPAPRSRSGSPARRATPPWRPPPRAWRPAR